MTEIREPQHIVNMIDAKGWPDALEYLVNDNYEDAELSQIIYDAAQHYLVLEGFLKQLENKVVELGADWYIG